MVRKRVGVLVSGRGSNLQALLDACADSAFPAEIALVIANVADAPALARAERAGVATRTIPHRDFPSREDFDAALDRALREAGIDIVCLAGFMRILTPGFVEGWRGRMINVHPALLPAFKGLDTHARALAEGVKLHGCTVHLVVPDLDAGPILAQAAVPVLDGDDADALAARVLIQEHRLYPLALKLLAEGRVRIGNGRTHIDAPAPDGVLANPQP